MVCLESAPPTLWCLIDTTGCIPLLQLHLLRLSARVNEKAWAEELPSTARIYWALLVQPWFFEDGWGSAEWQSEDQGLSLQRLKNWNMKLFEKRC